MVAVTSGVGVGLLRILGDMLIEAEPEIPSIGIPMPGT